MTAVGGKGWAADVAGSIIESAPDAVVVIDAAGSIRFVNAQTEVLFGYQRDEILGLEVEVLLPERFREAHVGHRDRYTREPKVRPMGANLDLFGRRKDGSEFPIDISLAPIATDEPLFFASVRDVTERERLSRLRDEFVRNAAHELRTPLAALAGFAELLANDRGAMTAEDVEDSLQAMRRQGERANALVANLLDMSRLEGRRADIKFVPISVRQAVMAVLESAPAPEGRSIQVTVGDDVRVMADRTRLEQLLTNLVVNAYRYGGDSVEIAAEVEDGTVTLSVSDDGEGIPDELRATLFDPFTRGRNAGQVGGSGIGLALCRLLAQAFDGEIWFESVNPTGARFNVRLRAER